LRYSQVVRQRFLVPSCAGSNPANAIVLKNTQPEKRAPDPVRSSFFAQAKGK
jgi:hypothetical protein